MLELHDPPVPKVMTFAFGAASFHACIAVPTASLVSKVKYLVHAPDWSSFDPTCQLPVPPRCLVITKVGASDKPCPIVSPAVPVPV